MLLKKIPKRTIITYHGELKDTISLLFSDSGNNNNFVQTFEDRFKRYIGSSEAIAVSSGRFALTLILKNLGVKKGDGVILSAYNFPGVPKALLKEGFRLQFVDAHKDTYQMDIDKLEENIDNHSKALIVTHLFGQPCNMDKILKIARRHQLFVIEDAAHSLGSLYGNKFTATLGDAGFFSFSGSKALNTCFGGMAVTNNNNLAKKIRDELENYSFPPKRELIREVMRKYIYSLLSNRSFYSFTEYPVGLMMSLFNIDLLEVYKNMKKTEITEKKFKFTALQALIGRKQIHFVSNLIQKRKKVASLLIKYLDPCIFLQEYPRESEASYFMFPIRSKKKSRVFKKLLLKGIDPNFNYVQDCSYLTSNSYNPVARFLSETILTINLPYDLNKRDILEIAKILNGIKAFLR